MAGADELLPPVEYSSSLLVVAVALPLLVLSFYVLVTLRTRRPRPAPVPEPRPSDARREALTRLDRIEAETAAGTLPLRVAHQQVSEVVRGYAAQVGDVDARVLTLGQLRATSADGLVDVLSLVYPPEFAPGDEGSPAARLAPALRDARELVTGWGP